MVIRECNKLAQKGVQDKARLGRKGNSLGIVQEIEIGPSTKKSVIENKTHKILQHFEIQRDHLILAGRPDLVLINNSKKKKKI